MNYKVSIIIPIYNVESYIQQSLLSALNQTVESIEYILIDDCGTDNSIEIVNQIILNHDRRNDIKCYKHSYNMGLSAARNTGLEKATGQYVFFMDSDDEITNDCIELHLKTIKKYNADFTVANVLLLGAKSDHIKPIPTKIKLDCPIESYLKHEWSVSAWNKLYNARFLKENKLKFKENLLHEDVLWSYQISLSAKKIALVKESTYLYKIREGSIVTSKNGNRKLDSLLYILKILHSDWNKGKIVKKIEKSFNSFFDYWRFVTALQLLNYNGDEKERMDYYNKISKLCIIKYHTLYSMFLMLPFRCFSMVRPIYNYYKNRK